MGANSRDDYPKYPVMPVYPFSGAVTIGPDHAQAIARLEQKIDALTAALVKPQSSIILVGDDIARIAAELNRRK